MECSDDNSTIGNTTNDAAADLDGFRPPSRRQQRKTKGSTNSDSDTGRKRTGAKLVPTGGTGPQPVLATAAIPAIPIVLREKVRWTTLNTEILREGIRTTKVVNTNVGIWIQPTTADDYRQLMQAVTALNMQPRSRLPARRSRRTQPPSGRVRPKPSKQPRRPPTKPTPAIVEEVADYDALETTFRPEANVFDTFSQLIPLIQKINWQKLLQVAASLLPKLLKCRSIPEAGLLLAGHLQDILAIFSHNE
ncbi:hypothetical protein Trydic_g4653 [Trypoxylus dichotomus]